MVQLVLDVLPVVFASLSSADLVRAGRTCKLWLGPAYDMLYSSLTVSPNNIQLIHNTFGRYKFLRPKVHALVANEGWYWSHSEANKLVDLVGWLKNLQQLDVVLVPRLSGVLHQLRRLERVRIGRREVRDEDGTLMLLGVNDVWLVTLLPSWPKLQSIELEYWLFKSHDWTPPMVCPAHLTEIRLKGAQLTHDEVAWIVSGSSQTLKVFTYSTHQPYQYKTELPSLNSRFGIDQAKLVVLLSSLSHLQYLCLAIPMLASDSIAATLPALYQLCHLALPFIALKADTLAYAPASLDSLEVFHTIDGNEQFSRSEFASGRSVAWKLGAVGRLRLRALGPSEGLPYFAVGLKEYAVGRGIAVTE